MSNNSKLGLASAALVVVGLTILGGWSGFGAGLFLTGCELAVVAGLRASL